MNAVNDFLLLIDGFLGSAWWFPYFLLGSGLFFSIYLKFPQLRFFTRAWRLLFKDKKSKGALGETSHFQALATALSGTVGTGNIAGVGFAIFLGGPAAIFWMWATAFFGMTLKLVEVTLSHKYREQTADGTVAGGPMYFMDKGLGWKPLAILFAIATVISSFGTGNLPQINSIAVAMNSSFGIKPIVTGAVLAVLLALVIIGGIRRIAAFTSSVMPAMAAIYLIGALAVIIFNIENVIPSFVAIFRDVFTGSAASGGFLGATIAYAFNRGVNRGLFSNEAGQGSAPIAHASAKTDEPVSEGLVSLLEPFIDTIIICTLTGLVVLASGVWTQKFVNEFDQTDLSIVSGVYSDSNPDDVKRLFNYLVGSQGSDAENAVQSYAGELQVRNGRIVSGNITALHARSIAEDLKVFDLNENGEKRLSNLTLVVEDGQVQNRDLVFEGKTLLHSAALTTEAFTKSFFGDFGRYIVAISLLLFAFSTAVSWSYYGDRAMTYLVGVKGILPYRILYVLGFFCAAVVDTVLVWNIAAITIVLMAVPNIVCLIVMRKEVKSTIDEYIRKN